MGDSPVFDSRNLGGMYGEKEALRKNDFGTGDSGRQNV